MVKRIFLLASAAFTVAPYIVAPAAFALDYPKQAYDATYEMVSPQGKTEMRMASDGKGKTLTKTNSMGQQVRMVADFKAGTCTTLMDTAKMAITAKMTEANAQGYDENWYKKKKGVKQLGAKVIAGHPCHGYEYSESGTTSQTWVGDDVKIMVQSVTDTPKVGKTTMTLKKIAGAPAATEFNASIPAGYKTMNQ